MTADEWKAKYYPVDAVAFHYKDKEDLRTQIEATKHSLQKWIGLRSKNRPDGGLMGIEVSSRTCALCQLAGNCELCPLFDYREGVACDDRRDDEENSPYHEFVNCRQVNPNPEPMIKALEGTLKMLQEIYNEHHTS